MQDIKLKDLSWVVRWSIVQKCQTLMKCIFNNIEETALVKLSLKPSFSEEGSG